MRNKEKNESATQSISKQPTAELPTINVNGRELVKVYADGRWWIAIKPICEVLKVDYEQQRKNLKEDEILSGVPCNHTVHDASNRKQEMVCIPERFIYGWLFGIQSKSEKLKAFKLECYNVLFDYFHGNSSRRNIVLKETTLLDKQIEYARELIAELPEVKKLKELEAQKQLGIKTLKLLDREYVGKQLPIWNEETRLQTPNTLDNE